ncbi:MAG: hypothetical protein H7831_12095 [Magnetococcus sp. WYHC-3]
MWKEYICPHCGRPCACWQSQGGEDILDPCDIALEDRLAQTVCPGCGGAFALENAPPQDP